MPHSRNATPTSFATDHAVQHNGLAEEILDLRIHLSPEVSTPIHIAKYRKNKVRPRLVVFDQHAKLLRWCKENNITDAINGGFTLHHTNTLLGEHWSHGTHHNYLPFPAPWHTIRGSLHITPSGVLRLAPRSSFPTHPDGDLLQTAPLLVQNSMSLMAPGQDPEGIAASADQFDDDWTVERFPRAAIGVSNEFIWCVATDGYSPPEHTSTNAGLSLHELADIMVKIGATDALNLDGGSSATLISKSRLINSPSAGIRDNYQHFPEGRQIPSAIVFESA